MSVARNASATTSLPNPAALTPAGTGRSKADHVPPLAGRVFALSILLLDTVSAGPLPPAGGTAASNRITRPDAIGRAISARRSHRRGPYRPFSDRREWP